MPLLSTRRCVKPWLSTVNELKAKNGKLIKTPLWGVEGGRPKTAKNPMCKEHRHAVFEGHSLGANSDLEAP